MSCSLVYICIFVLGTIPIMGGTSGWKISAVSLMTSDARSSSLPPASSCSLVSRSIKYPVLGISSPTLMWLFYSNSPTTCKPSKIVWVSSMESESSPLLYFLPGHLLPNNYRTAWAKHEIKNQVFPNGQLLTASIKIFACFNWHLHQKLNNRSRVTNILFMLIYPGPTV